MLRARRPRDVLVHQRPTQVVGPGAQQLARALAAHFDPTHLNVVDVARVGDARHGVHQHGLAEGRSPPRLLLEVDRGGHVHEGERHELGEAPGLALEIPGAHNVTGPATGCSTEPNMMVMLERRPTPCAVRCASNHSSVLILSGQMSARTSSSRISAAVPGSVLRPGLLQAGQVLGQRDLGPARALGHLQGREAVDVDVGRTGPHRLEHVQVVVPVEVGVDAALQADLGRTLVDRLHHPPRDLVELQQVRRPRRLSESGPFEKAQKRHLNVQTFV